MEWPWRKIVAEILSTAFLLAAVVGSGVMAEKLAGGNIALALFANAVATGAALVALIIAFDSVSGAHMNPVVTLMMAIQKGMAWSTAALYVIAQLAGAFAGVLTAHLMFGLPLIQTSLHARNGLAQYLSEFVATFGLLIVVQGAARAKSSYIPFAVGAYITAAYWFTSSTAFANPAVTLARTVTNTFSGIRPGDAPSFIAAQLAACAAATIFSGWLFSNKPLPMKKRVLILCTANSARSQMAEGLLRYDAGDRFHVASAGTKATAVRPEAIAVMRELGVDIGAARSKSVDEFAGESFDYVITVCDNAREACPIYPGHANRIHQTFEDPAGGGRLSDFRRVRDEIREFLRAFAADH